MSIGQFVNSIGIIWRNEHTNVPVALGRHVWWQVRRLAFPIPVRRRLSRSIITDDQAVGVISLVNMLGMYDYNNMSFVQLLLALSPEFVDVGANIGAYTLIASEVPGARVLSLEPNPTAFAKLVQNVRLNERTNVIACNLGASSVGGSLRMTNDGASPLNRMLATGESSPSTIEVRVETLDALCHTHGIAPSLIKIDVEGHEPEVLAGASTCLTQAMACIVENGERPAIVERMRQFHYLGPLYYSHQQRKLLAAPLRLSEDAVFVSQRFLQAFPEIDVATGAASV